MGLWRSFAGIVQICITSANIPEALKIMTDHNITVMDVLYRSEISVTATIKRTDWKRANSLLSHRCHSCTRIRRIGIFWNILQIKNRPIFAIGVVFLMFLTVFVPTRVLFIQVEGNQRVSSCHIIETAQSEGLRLGCQRTQINSEQLKNGILERIPQISWVGVTSCGCTVTIEVKEALAEEKNPQNGVVSSLVAVCDGIVESITVTNGTPLCKPGQAVYRGQVLISGYQDHGLIIKASAAQGEIYARTYRQFRIVTPVQNDNRTEMQEIKTNYSLQIGKKQINLSQGSGISPTRCVKIYEKKYLELPGGFQLPIAWIIEKVYYYECESASDTLVRPDWIESFAVDYVRSQLAGGQVIRQDLTLESTDDIYYLTAGFACREQIGQTRIEESIIYNGENS